MTATAGRIELWRRAALLVGIIAGAVLFFYITPAVVSVTTVDWEKEQADELKPAGGFVTSTNKRLSQLPLEEYIEEKTGGKVAQVDPGQWAEFFQQVQLASSCQDSRSIYSNRLSEQDRDSPYRPSGPAPVFFKPGELPFTQWGLAAKDGDSAYINTAIGGRAAYLLLGYHDYSASISAMYRPYRVAPGWLFHPYRNTGAAILALALLLYIFLPRRKRQPVDIIYSTGSMVGGDLVALILLAPFFSLPFIINGGTTQAFTGMWPITIVMWLFAGFGVLLLYYNAWNSSFRVELTPDALYLVTFKGVREYRFDEMAEAGIVSLRNPGWFRKLFFAVAFLSLLGGRPSAQPAGHALLAETAAYGGLEIRGRSGDKPLYIWFGNQIGGVIIKNFNRVPRALRSAGVQFNEEPREIEGFQMFMKN